jgi:hypothetical protein
MGAGMKPTSETLEILRNITTEISAGKCLIPRTRLEEVHNNACDRAIAIIRNYMDGCGLFQNDQSDDQKRTV